MHARIAVEDRSQVAQARREAVALARADWRLRRRRSRTRPASSSPRSATNLVKHAGGGELLLCTLLGERDRRHRAAGARQGSRHVERRRKPARRLLDRRHVPGTGWARSRAYRIRASRSTRRPGDGTACSPASLRGRRRARDVGRLRVSARSACRSPARASAATPGLVAATAIGRTLFVVADGLGHGPDAARRPRAAARHPGHARHEPPTRCSTACMAALRSTRGAAVARRTVIDRGGTQIGYSPASATSPRVLASAASSRTSSRMAARSATTCARSRPSITRSGRRALAHHALRRPRDALDARRYPRSRGPPPRVDRRQCSIATTRAAATTATVVAAQR